MDMVRTKMAERLEAKGLEKNEVELFIKDVIRIVTSFTGSNLDACKGQLLLLGWREDYTDLWDDPAHKGMLPR